MEKMISLRKNLVADVRGASIVEYVVLICLIMLAAVAGFTKLGKNVSAKVNSAAEVIGGLDTGDGKTTGQ